MAPHTKERKKRQHGKFGNKPHKDLNKESDTAPVTNLAASIGSTVSIPIENIIVGPSRRATNKERVREIAESMRQIGQTTPIWVREKSGFKPVTVLIAGLHRIEAKKLLGEKMINAVYFEVNEEEAQWLENSENLDRADLTALQRAEHIHQRVEWVAEKKAAQGPTPGGRQPADKGYSAAARFLGYTRDEIRRSELIAKLPPAVKAKATELNLDDNQKALLQIAKQEESDKQITKAGLLAAKPKRRPDEANRATDRKMPLDWWQGARFAAAVLSKASESDRNRILRQAKRIRLSDDEKD
jgi:ParB-like chromosome segregation protein Spo0J